MIKLMWTDLDFKGMVTDCGIFVGILYLVVVIISTILLLPIVPFRLFNDWSKTWFSRNSNS